MTTSETTPNIALLDLVLDQIDRVTMQHEPRIVEHPNGITLEEEQHWMQSSWRNFRFPIPISRIESEPRCRTAMCFAGWVAELDDSVTWAITPRMFYEATLESMRAQRVLDKATGTEEYDRLMVAYNLAQQERTDLEFQASNLVVDGENVQVEEWARERLGLSFFQAETLFAAGNELDTLHRIVDRLRENPQAYLDEDESNDDYDYEEDE